MRCPKCKRVWEDGAIFCTEDGSRLVPNIEEKVIVQSLKSSEYDAQHNEEIKKNIEAGLQSRLNSENIRPWVRYWARLLDYIIGIPLIAFIVAVVGYAILPSITNDIVKNEFSIAFLSLTIWRFIEAPLLSSWGYTPGKWLLKVMVRDNDGNKLTYKKALTRAVYVFVYGEALGVPIASMITWIIAYGKLTSNGITSWDRDGQIDVTHQKIGVFRAIVAIIVIIGIPAVLKLII